MNHKSRCWNKEDYNENVSNQREHQIVVRVRSSRDIYGGQGDSVVTISSCCASNFLTIHPITLPEFFTDTRNCATVRNRSGNNRYYYYFLYFYCAPSWTGGPGGRMRRTRWWRRTNHPPLPLLGFDICPNIHIKLLSRWGTARSCSPVFVCTHARAHRNDTIRSHVTWVRHGPLLCAASKTRARCLRLDAALFLGNSQILYLLLLDV